MASGNSVLQLTKLNDVIVNLADNTATATCYIRTKRLQIHPKGRECYIDGIRFEITKRTGLGNAHFRIGWIDTLGDDDSLSDVNWYADDNGNTEFSLEDANSVFDVRMEARFVIIEITDEQIQRQWILSAIELYGRVMGGRRY